MKKRYIVWTSEINLDDWEDLFVDEYADLPEYEKYELASETNAEYLEDERRNLDIQLPENILVIADLGLWDGRHSGYKEIQSGNVADCLYSEYDATWYVDDYGNLRCEDRHHDGCNYYLYRVWKSDVSETEKETLREKILRGKVTPIELSKLTRSVGREIAAVYGWPVRGRSVKK